jgi:hypothetical protein
MGRKWEANASLLGLKETLEDSILEVMDNIAKESWQIPIESSGGMAHDILKREEVERYITRIVYEVIGDIFRANTSSCDSRAIRENIYQSLEMYGGFSRLCPTCNWNTMKYGKLPKPNC